MFVHVLQDNKQDTACYNTLTVVSAISLSDLFLQKLLTSQQLQKYKKLYCVIR
jgi:hypothetical protein